MKKILCGILGILLLLAMTGAAAACTSNICKVTGGGILMDDDNKITFAVTANGCENNVKGNGNIVFHDGSGTKIHGDVIRLVCSGNCATITINDKCTGDIYKLIIYDNDNGKNSDRVFLKKPIPDSEPLASFTIAQGYIDGNFQIRPKINNQD